MRVQIHLFLVFVLVIQIYFQISCVLISVNSNVFSRSLHFVQTTFFLCCTVRKVTSVSIWMDGWREWLVDGYLNPDHLLKWNVDLIQSGLSTANDGQTGLALAFLASAIIGTMMQWVN